jgi:hypothetical protein
VTLCSHELLFLAEESEKLLRQILLAFFRYRMSAPLDHAAAHGRRYRYLVEQGALDPTYLTHPLFGFI